MPRNQLHRIVRVAVLNAVAEQADDVGVLEFFERFDLGAEALAETLLVGQVRVEQLDGGRVVSLDIDRLVDRPHSAAAELFDDLVRAKLFELHGLLVNTLRSGAAPLTSFACQCHPNRSVLGSYNVLGYSTNRLAQLNRPVIVDRDHVGHRHLINIVNQKRHTPVQEDDEHAAVVAARGAADSQWLPNKLSS